MRLKRNPIILWLLDGCLWLALGVPALIDHIIASSKQARETKRILVIELWGLGDLVMMTAILKPLRERFPGARIYLLAKAVSQELFQGHPYIDQIITFDFPWTRFSGKYRFWKWPWRSLWQCLSSLRDLRFDLCVDARGDIRNNLLSFLVHARRRVGYANTGGGYLLTDRLPDSQGLHRVKTWQQISRYLGSGQPGQLILWLSEEERLQAKQFLETHAGDQGAVGIHPGAQIKLRCWPLERFAEVVRYVQRRYHASVFVFVEPGGYGADISPDKSVLRIQEPLRKVMALIEKMPLFICNDSGMMHVAAAFGVPTVAIFGPGDQALISPVNPAAHIVSTKIECNPCNDACIWKSAICLERVSVLQVTKALDQILSHSH